MKRVFKTLSFIAFVGGVSSCTISHTALVTNNAVGSKTGVAKAHNLQPNMDYTLATAKKNGGVEKIGVAETKVKNYLGIFWQFTTTVSGE